MRLWVLTVLLSGFYLSTSSAEDTEQWNPVPIPSPALERVETDKDQPFEGAKNKPPFDLATAQKCEAELKTRRIAFTVKEQISDERGCIVERPLLVNSLSGGITLSNDMTLRCEVLLALDDWTKDIVRPTAKLHLGQDIKRLQTSTSYHCRTRNNKPGGKISEHGFANGADISGFALEDETVINVSSKEDNLTEDILSKSKFLAGVRAGACAYFTTVLGPGSDGSHQDHFHVDRAYRKSGYRLCE
ncbi:MAG: extensin family protein [Rhizobiaceae bacterium]|nr:extensin family protein [Rhizobiaceae bacterium]